MATCIPTHSSYIHRKGRLTRYNSLSDACKKRSDFHSTPVLIKFIYGCMQECDIFVCTLSFFYSDFHILPERFTSSTCYNVLISSHIWFLFLFKMFDFCKLLNTHMLWQGWLTSTHTRAPYFERTWCGGTELERRYLQTFVFVPWY